MRHLETIWRATVDALRGAPADCTQGCLNRSMVLLTVPTVLELTAESFVVLVDLLWVARLGGTALAAAGWASAVMILVAACAQGFSLVTGSAIARAMGRGDRNRAGEDGALGLAIAGPRQYGHETVDGAWMGDGRTDVTAEDIDRSLKLYINACIIHGLIAVTLLTWL